MDSKGVIFGATLILWEILIAYLIFKNKSPKWTLIAILILGLAIRIIPALDINLHQWDECYHALVAKNISKNGLIPTLYPRAILPYRYTDWSTNYIWLHKPPLTLWIIAMFLKVFGYFAFVVRMPSILFSVATIYMVYKIGIQVSKSQVALLAAYLFCINGFLIELCAGRIASDHIDTLFLFFIALGILLSLKDAFASNEKYFIPLLIGIITGLAILTKWIVGFFILLLYFIALKLYNKQSKTIQLKKLFIAFIFALFVFLPWDIFAYIHFPKEYLYEQFYNFAHFTKPLEGQNNPFWFFIDKARINWNELIYFHIVYFIYMSYRKKYLNNAFLLLWVGIPYLLFSAASTKMPAYIIICAPAIFLIISWNIFCTDHFRFKKIIVILTIGFAIRYSIERIKPFERFHQQKSIPQLTNLLKNIQKPIVMVGYKDNIQAMFFYDIIAYLIYPSEVEFAKMKKTNVQIIAVDTYDLPHSMRIDSSVIKFKYNPD